MADLADPTLATVYALQASMDVMAALDGGIVQSAELRDDVVPVMPTKTIVVADAGGLGSNPGSYDTIRFTSARVDVRCYGHTPREAKALSLAVLYALKTFQPGVIQRHLVQCFTPSSGPIAFRDPDGSWPVSVVSFVVLVADELVPIAG